MGMRADMRPSMASSSHSIADTRRMIEICASESISRPPRSLTCATIRSFHRAWDCKRLFFDRLEGGADRGRAHRVRIAEGFTMSQRPLLFVVIAACLSSSVLIWSQTLLLDRSRQDAAETLRSERHEPRREEGRNVAESTFNLRPLSRNRTNMAAGIWHRTLPKRRRQRLRSLQA